MWAFTKKKSCSGILRTFFCHTVWNYLSGKVWGSLSNHLLKCSQAKHLRLVGCSVSDSVTHQQSSEELNKSELINKLKLFHGTSFLKLCEYFCLKFTVCSCLHIVVVFTAGKSWISFHLLCCSSKTPVAFISLLSCLYPKILPHDSHQHIFIPEISFLWYTVD